MLMMTLLVWRRIRSLLDKINDDTPLMAPVAVSAFGCQAGWTLFCFTWLRK
jgi:hypothetical protein